MNTIVILFLFGLVVHQTNGNFREDGWQEPNAWDRHTASYSAQASCPVCPVADEEALAGFYYKKLVANLFNKKILKTNEYTGNLERAIIFTITAVQLEVIENFKDIRDVDAAVTDILRKIKTPKGEYVSQEGFLWLCKDILKDCFKIVLMVLQNSEMRFIFFIAGVILLIWFIHKRYNKNLIAAVGIVFFVFGYVCTYWECNRKLEAEKDIAFIKQQERTEEGLLGTVFPAIFGSSKTNDLHSKIRDNAKVKFPFCRPDHVLMMYFNEMFLGQLQLIIEKCMEMVATFKGLLRFPYNIIAMLAIPCLVVFITKLFFEHILSPAVWYRVLSGGDNTNHQPQQPPQVASNEDRLTGDNLKILLNALVKPHTQKEPTSSGVQEILEPIEGRSSPSKSDESVTSNESGVSDLNVKENEEVTKQEREMNEKENKEVTKKESLNSNVQP